MKKIVFTLIFALVGISSAFAQFEKGKYYLAATTNSGGFSYSKAHKARFNLGVNGGYMFEEACVHGAPNFNDVQITPEVGYCFFLNRHLTIEPSLYYDVSLSDFSEKSEFGVKVGLAWYFENSKKPSDYIKRKKK